MPKLKAKKKENPEQIQEQIQEQIPEQMNQKQNLIDSEPEINLVPEIDKLQELKEVSENSEEVPKKKRGRKPKSETVEIPEVPEIDLSPLLEIAIKRLPNPIPLTDSEKQIFNQTSNKVFQKYSGNFKYIEELNLSLVLVSLIYPRLKREVSGNEIS